MTVTNELSTTTIETSLVTPQDSRDLASVLILLILGGGERRRHGGFNVDDAVRVRASRDVGRTEGGGWVVGVMLMADMGAHRDELPGKAEVEEDRRKRCTRMGETLRRSLERDEMVA